MIQGLNQIDQLRVNLDLLKIWINEPTKADTSYSAMHLAAYNGSIEVIEYLQKYGGNLNATN